MHPPEGAPLRPPGALKVRREGGVGGHHDVVFLREVLGAPLAVGAVVHVDLDAARELALGLRDPLPHQGHCAHHQRGVRAVEGRGHAGRAGRRGGRDGCRPVREDEPEHLHRLPQAHLFAQESPRGLLGHLGGGAVQRRGVPVLLPPRAGHLRPPKVPEAARQRLHLLHEGERLKLVGVHGHGEAIRLHARGPRPSLERVHECPEGRHAPAPLCQRAVHVLDELAGVVAALVGELFHDRALDAFAAPHPGPRTAAGVGRAFEEGAHVHLGRRGEEPGLADENPHVQDPSFLGLRRPGLLLQPHLDAHGGQRPHVPLITHAITIPFHVVVPGAHSLDIEDLGEGPEVVEHLVRLVLGQVGVLNELRPLLVQLCRGLDSLGREGRVGGRFALRELVFLEVGLVQHPPQVDPWVGGWLVPPACPLEIPHHEVLVDRAGLGGLHQDHIGPLDILEWV
mmetsp:Transcript_2632/g.8884  ORF Transcript_2632/g.8884 Transcript_2632/m.8884 type:complete len:453 (+) Transcript_2632:1291-2649(+)